MTSLISQDNNARLFTLTEAELEGLLAAAEYSKRAEAHVAEIQNCFYMKRVTKDVGPMIDRLRRALHEARRMPAPDELEPLTHRAMEWLVKYHTYPFVTFMQAPPSSTTDELMRKECIESGQRCTFEKWGSEPQFKPSDSEPPYPVFRLTAKGLAFARAVTGEEVIERVSCPALPPPM